jgi:DNA-binding transcriptional LysR family regulator
MTRRASSLDNPTAVFAGDAARALAPVDEAELRQLRLFCVVVAAGGFSAATAELQADLSTVSRQFKELETRVGTRLAQRGRGGFALTTAGQQLHQAALALLGSLQGFREQVARLGEAPAPQLRLGIVDALLTTPAAPLPAALARCADALPGLQLQLLSLRPIEIERRILAGELDAGILAAHPPAAGLQQQRLYAEASSLYVGPGHPWFKRSDSTISRDSLAEIDCVADPYSVDLPAPARAAAGPGSPRADSIEGVALLVVSGRYAGFLPDHLVASNRALSALRRVQPALFSHQQDIVLTCRRGKATAPLRQLLRELASQR